MFAASHLAMSDIFDMDEIFKHFVQRGTTMVRRKVAASEYTLTLTRHSFLVRTQILSSNRDLLSSLLNISLSSATNASLWPGKNPTDQASGSLNTYLSPAAAP